MTAIWLGLQDGWVTKIRDPEGKGYLEEKDDVHIECKKQLGDIDYTVDQWIEIQEWDLGMENGHWICGF